MHHIFLNALAFPELSFLPALYMFHSISPKKRVGDRWRNITVGPYKEYFGLADARKKTRSDQLDSEHGKGVPRPATEDGITLTGRLTIMFLWNQRLSAFCGSAMPKLERLGEAAPILPDNVVPWCGALPEQADAAQSILIASPVPLAPQDIARAFKGKCATTVRPAQSADSACFCLPNRVELALLA